MTDADRSGPRKYVPVPGLVDLDGLEDDPDPVVPPAAPVQPAAEAPTLDTAPDAALSDDDAAPEAAVPAPAAPEAAAPEAAPRLAEAGTAEPESQAPPREAAPVSEALPADEAPRVAGDPDAEASASRALVPIPVVESAREAARGRGRELIQLILRYGRAHIPETPRRDAAPDTGPPRMVGRVGQIIPFLQVIPWILGVVFVASFFAGDAELTLFGRTSSVGELLQVLSVSGLIGFGTNWLAITMLFQPREKRVIIPQGLIPAQRERVIYRLSEAISKELINADIIKQKIQESGVIGRYRDLAVNVIRGTVEDPGFRADLKELASGYAQEVLGSEAVRREVAQLAVQKVEEQAGQGLGGVALRLYRTFAEDDFQRRLDRALDELPSAVAPLLDRIDAALDAVPAKVEARADEIEEAATKAVLSFVESFDIRAMIQEKARGFDEAQLENLLKSTSNEQLNYIKYLGAILGVFGGFVIWQPVGALVLFVGVGLALWAADEALVRARRARE